ncbi:type II secretion system protein E [Caenimonas sedimenti]|uniref:Type II secretion system protein E n=1 Tax=Caenimonas sedimenti TaxID=2596921 RepID=A0A562ZST6_9BURK|nr:ATPase, T2SS/T4P/T4SS family [Caenimonas sedimenti]TWO71426.1 type II secretion system protein E [Caenimonas sedimenti]
MTTGDFSASEARNDAACNPRDFTDLHIRWSSKEGSPSVDTADCLVFPRAKAGERPKPRRAPQESFTLLHELAASCHSVASSSKDFLIHHSASQTFFRGRLDERAVDGKWYRLRVISDEPPKLEKLAFPMPGVYVDQLLDASYSKGGLIVILGQAGSGKTHTASATVVSRLHKFGGMAFTVEDPPELPLNGWHGEGYCTQASVAGDDGRDWVESMRGALRSQPVGTDLMMYLGELRDAAAAQMALRAATNGFLVICTSFASDIISGLEAVLNLAGREHAHTLAHVLRVAIYQSLVQTEERLLVDSLTSEGPASKVGVIIRSGDLRPLEDESRYQKNQIRIEFMRRNARQPAAASA